MKGSISNRVIDRLEAVFQVLFLVYTILGFNSVTFGSRIISLIVWPTYLLGVFLLCLRLWNWRSYFQMPGLAMLLLMCVVCGISILINIRYDFKKNIIYLFFWVVYFFLYYLQNRNTSSAAVKQRFLLLGNIVCVAAFILVLISLGMMAARYSEVTHINGSEVTRGFVYGRLFGAYLTPNTGAVFGSIVIFLAIYFMGVYRGLAGKVFAAANIFVQFVYITLSDSRSGTLALAFGGAVYVCFSMLERLNFKCKLLKSIVTAAVVIVTFFGCMFAPSVAKNGYNDIVINISMRLEQQDNTEQASKPSKPIQSEQIIDSFVVDRGYDLSKDISNRRFDVWKSGLEIFKQRPWFGTTFCGFLPYAQEYMPETYIVNNDYLQMDTLDSDFVNLLVSNGIIGFSAFVVFVIWIIVYLLRGYPKLKTKHNEIPVMMAVCMAAATFSVFTSGVLYMQSPFSVMFWLSLGGLVMIVANADKENENVQN